METRFTQADASHIPQIAALLRDDVLGIKVESQDISYYQNAFAEIIASPHDRLLVALQGDLVVACLQVTFIRHLVSRGAKRAQIEGVRTRKEFRRQGLGKQLITYAIELAKEQGCTIVQLTTNKVREDAALFYQNLGFAGNHVGYKLELGGS